MISLSKLYNFKYSVGAILSAMPVSRKLEYWKSKERGTHCLQSCKGRHFAWKENELSKLRKTWPI